MRVLFLHHSVVQTKMTRERMANISATYGQPGGRMTLERQYLDCCWIPHEMAAAWCAARNVNTVHRCGVHPAKQSTTASRSPT